MQNTAEESLPIHSFTHNILYYDVQHIENDSEVVEIKRILNYTYNPNTDINCYVILHSK